MKDIRIEFVDFWPDLRKTNNYFYNLLSEYYNVIIDSEHPDLVFYSCFGYDHLKYNCKRIFFTGENKKPDFLACDFAFSFEFSAKKNHLRVPLYLFYIDDHKMINKLENLQTKETYQEIWAKKTKFCCMIVSNPRASKRIEFFHKLSEIKKVDSGGKVLNNVGGRIKDKMEFINDYKFVFSFENETHEGYTTEKIVEPIFKDCIPIYWGNKKVHKDFNSDRFLNYHDFNSEEELIEKLIQIDQNFDLGVEMIAQPVFSKEKQDWISERREIFVAIDTVFKSKKKPVAKTYRGKLYRLKIKLTGAKRRLKKLLK
ncbi:glycosyltransferase family 10 domain-containing protein [Flavobacterium saccharophilum]|uniref:Glycosyltransferase family 10 (Fucosyltransferase) C-term n=1 Tax=Flavobacterium saccharophilum TaxID=29534 RepID=A0A1M7K7D1_9FLAO|nr:glycosyltransferase family 10 [Flavobacterium saccharophilum]SHM61190.1 Glycosyltransferase family 10 (fucosyltransferase) C-term [Flavobacterium saccharophilum]